MMALHTYFHIKKKAIGALTAHYISFNPFQLDSMHLSAHHGNGEQKGVYSNANSHHKK